MAFTVDDAAGIFKKAVERGAKPIQEPEELKDEKGVVVLSSVQSYGDTIHTFVERKNYSGTFFPGFIDIPDSEMNDPISKFVPAPDLQFIDHVVGNQPENEMEATAQWYEKMLDFHRFWSVDDTMLHTEYSALNSIVMADFDENIKMPINEPAKGKRKS